MVIYHNPKNVSGSSICDPGENVSKVTMDSKVHVGSDRRLVLNTKYWSLTTGSPGGFGIKQSPMYSLAWARGKFSRAQPVAKWCHALIQGISAANRWKGDPRNYRVHDICWSNIFSSQLKNPTPLKRRRRSWMGRSSPQGASCSDFTEEPKDDSIIEALRL